ncbi:tRNA (adenosine(37)-N6)-threonylcarbamoyltransferase complex ATPase subunit type 1 TsaE [Sphingomicrobium sediminis]|uniref:tRNA threonylcarbamoyladenosine biosynthesis protein TsaE n=1 Tax=Sphingomicrobium sediminis TaxID=2950949 RepID=A0A9X2J140_9SPHN|nr:tRNA (adenosine(37)-N6)-threonylcarbamoyltransferase complex ATPase subunit type 1 TsaE [Sphingomicrobium sediminis]
MRLADEAATRAIGAELAKLVRAGDVITLSGELGVGKTSLVRGALEAMGHEGEVPSPSFAIVQPYEHLDPPVWHVDLYRLERESELMELGLDDLSDAVLFVEWPEQAGRWDHALQLRIERDEEQGVRRLTSTVPPAWKERWPFR